MSIPHKVLRRLGVVRPGEARTCCQHNCGHHPPKSIRRQFSALSESAATAPDREPIPKPDFRRRLREGPGLDYFTSGASKRPRANGSQAPGTRASRPSNPQPPGKLQPRDTHDTETLRSLAQSLIAQEAAVGVSLKDMLVDTHGRFHNYLRISLTERCNLRCVYCMPEDGVELQPAAKLLTTDEIGRIAQLFVKAGVDKIRLTGGEPTVRKDLVDIVRRIAHLGVRHIGITTNGLVLKSRVQALREAGLSHINVSLDTLHEEKFRTITRRKGLDHVLGGVDAALAAGFGGRLKINCVVMGGVNVDELAAFALLTRERPLDVRFIEWMPFDDNRWDGDKFVSYASMLQALRLEYPTMSQIEAEKNDTTKWHRIEGHQGRIGFITSMSEHFCGTCNRLRVMADGSLKVCLFDGSETLSLRDALRGGLSEVELSALVRAAVQKKPPVLGGHGDMFGIAKSSNRPMILIGG